MLTKLVITHIKGLGLYEKNDLILGDSAFCQPFSFSRVAKNTLKPFVWPLLILFYNCFITLNKKINKIS